MATIDDLNTSISKLSKQEAMEMLMAIRSNRRKKKITKKTTSRGKTGAKKKIDLKTLSSEQRAILIAELEDMLT